MTMNGLFTAPHLLLSIFVSTAAYVQLQGPRTPQALSVDRRSRQPDGAVQRADLLVHGSAGEAICDVRQFPELAAIAAQWQMIRDEALQLCTSSRRSDTTISASTPFFVPAGSGFI
jgi:hypothetical protein